MELADKLRILADAAKYDVSCSSSGSHRVNPGYGMGNAQACGICHSWTADGRCISLLKVLYTNVCTYDCAYCVNRRSNDIERASFTPDEVARLTMDFYRRNYIEGLFLSSAVAVSADRTMERLIRVAEILRQREGYFGYIHMKAIPGADLALVRRLGYLVDRLSINVEFATPAELALLAPDKKADSIERAMLCVRDRKLENLPVPYGRGRPPAFVPAGQSTQMIVGAGENAGSDRDILLRAQALYSQMQLKRVFYSAYIPVNQSQPCPPRAAVPLLREHRLYQADWLLRFYGFSAEEMMGQQTALDLSLDPKTAWAVSNYVHFPVDVNRAPYEALLRVPGIGVLSARRIIASRRVARLHYDQLRPLGVVMARAKYFVVAEGKPSQAVPSHPEGIYRKLAAPANPYQQVSFWEALA